MNRIILDQLIFMGSNKEPAVIKFQSGLNIITGPSNTGKTLIYQCINYVLGSSKKPKSPPEARGYTNLFLTIKAGEDTYTIERSTQSSDVRVFKAPYDRISTVSPQIVSSSANSPDSLSDILLGIIGIQGKRLKKNDRNETISLTFNVLKNLLLVDEIKIQSEASPIFSGITTAETQEKALFRFMLTGVDYAGLIAIQKSDVRKADATARIDLLNQLIQKNSAEVSNDSTLAHLEVQLAKMENTIKAEIDSMSQNELEIERLISDRKAYWDQIILIESKIDHLTELKNRFELLAQYYDNDLKRLDAIIETGDALTNIKTNNCPTCGAIPEHHQPDCLISDKQVSGVINACLIERGKIHALRSDLFGTISQLSDDIKNNTVKLNDSRQKYKGIDEQISSQLSPVIQASKEKIASLYGQQQHIQLSIKSQSQINSLKLMLDVAEKDLKFRPSKSKAEIGLFANEAGPFIDVVDETLKAWGYPELDKVYFSEIEQDFAIGEKNRIDQGKGYRALSHAAFIIALMQYCLSANSNHPGFVVLDSPLVTFRGADSEITAEDGISTDVKDSFFIALSKTPSDRQIIIIDNDEPPLQVKDAVNYISFTKDPRHGRPGFIPASI